MVWHDTVPKKSLNRHICVSKFICFPEKLNDIPKQCKNSSVSKVYNNSSWLGTYNSIKYGYFLFTR